MDQRACQLKRKGKNQEGGNSRITFRLNLRYTPTPLGMALFIASRSLQLVMFKPRRGDLFDASRKEADASGSPGQVTPTGV